MSKKNHWGARPKNLINPAYDTFGDTSIPIAIIESGSRSISFRDEYQFLRACEVLAGNGWELFQ